MQRGSTRAAYHTDGLGSVTLVSQVGESSSTLASYAYDAFGDDLGSSGSFENAYGFTGRERDGSGLYYYRARYYLPRIGRFLSPDPLGLAGGTNPYAYAASNPVNLTDPLGLTPIYSKGSLGNAISPVSFPAFASSTAGTSSGSGGLSGFASSVASGFAFHAVSGTKQLYDVVSTGVMLPFDFAAAVNREIGPTLDMLTFTATSMGMPYLAAPPVAFRSTLGGLSAIARVGRTGSLVAADAGIAARVAELRAVIPSAQQGRITMGLGAVEDASGARRVLIGTSEPRGYLRPGVTLAPGETLAPGFGHAEANIVNFAQQNRLQLLEVGATRPICPACAALIEGAGAVPVTPLKVP